MNKATIFGRQENPALDSYTFLYFAERNFEDRMTVRGAVDKATILLIILVGSAAWSWLSAQKDLGFGAIYARLLLASLAALFVALATSGNKRAAPYTAPLYAFLEGSVLGSLSASLDAQYPGWAVQAVFLTFGALFGLLLVYRVTGFHVTARFRAGVACATLAILLVYGVDLALQTIGVTGLHFFNKSIGFVGIAFHLYVVAVAAVHLVVDFDIIESGAHEGAPKYMEWYAAFGLMVTLVWLYLEVLELLIRIWLSSDHDGEKEQTS